jgi:DNA primase
MPPVRSAPTAVTLQKGPRMTLAPHEIIQASPQETSFGFRKCCEVVRDAVPIEVVARRYTDLESLGGAAWFTGRCPLPDHEDRTPSFYLYPQGRYWCYGCNRGGDVVDLEFFCGDYAELWEAMISLAVEYDVELPERPRRWFARQERQKPVRDALEEVKVHYVQRRLYRLFAPVIDRIEDQTERKAEKAQTWHELRHVAVLVVAGRRSA